MIDPDTGLDVKVDDKGEVIPDKDEKVDDKDIKPAKSGDDKDAPEPPADHPRFKEIYGKMKHLERELENRNLKDAERDEVIKSIKEHNKVLMEAVTGVQDKIDLTERPDPQEDPEGYDAWILNRVKRDIQKDAMDKKPDVEPAGAKPRVDVREVEMAGAHDDYYKVINSIRDDMASDSDLANQVWDSTNPFEYAYKYGKAKADKRAGKKKDDESQGFVEGNNADPSKKGVVLTTEQKRMAKNLGVSEKDYAVQLQYIEKGGK